MERATYSFGFFASSVIGFLCSPMESPSTPDLLALLGTFSTHISTTLSPQDATKRKKSLATGQSRSSNHRRTDLPLFSPPCFISILLKTLASSEVDICISRLYSISRRLPTSGRRSGSVFIGYVVSHLMCTTLFESVSIR